ncbi:MAG: hypothetical protein JSW27_06330 [Phycisphaerales bacterium]|nr:MAG: hypothetical protein JSW27_06330 [Phycisphaerales bacterium]
MQVSDDILSLLEEKGAQMAKEAQRAVILQPGALGDCILTLPLVKLMQEVLGMGGVDIVGHAEYIGILPGRSCVSSIRSIDSTELHRLFAESAKFDLADNDPLIYVFADYAWIVSFMGEPDGDFEQNLIFTTNCSHSAEIVTLSMKPPAETKLHVAEYYAQQLAQESQLPAEQARVSPTDVLIQVTDSDRNQGLELLEQAGIDVSKRLVVLQPGSGGRHKCWHLDNFLSIARALRTDDVEPVFLLGPVELERFERSQKADLQATATCLTHLALSQVVGLLSCADAYVGNDSGVTHLASGMGLRTFAMFGPTDPALYRPIGPAVNVLRDSTDRFAQESCPELQKTLLEHLSAQEERPTAS